jgi:Flp pilus assembly protein TadD
MMGLVVPMLSACVTLKSGQAITSATDDSERDALKLNLTLEEEKKFLLDYAALLIKSEQYDQAESVLLRLREGHLEPLLVYRLLGQLYERQNRPVRAQMAWEMVLKLGGDSVQDEAHLARVALMNKQFEISDGIYRRWLGQFKRGDRLYKMALNNLGFSLLLQEKLSESHELLTQAVELDPLDKKARNNLAYVLRLQGEFERARQQFLAAGNMAQAKDHMAGGISP